MSEYLIAFNDEWVAPHTPEELAAKGDAIEVVLAEMREQGVFVYGNGALDADTVVCSVTAEDGEPVFTDGPYSETVEHLGGFSVIDVPDDETARYWAGRFAVALGWPQEVHRFPSQSEMDDRMGRTSG